MKKSFLTAAAFALAITTSMATTAVADPVIYTPKTLSDALPFDVNGDGKTNAADWTPKSISDNLTGGALAPSDVAPGNNKPKNN